MSTFSPPVPILGLHHVTAVAGDPRRNDHFWTQTLGMRRVRKTVNFDDPGTYHLYFGDFIGRPGSLWTTFPHPQARPRRAGTPEVAVTSLAVPTGSLGGWQTRLVEAGVEVRQDEDGLHFDDPDGTTLSLVEADAPAEYEVPSTVNDAPRCLESVTLRSADPAATGQFLTAQFGFERQSETLYTCGDGAASRRVRVTGGDGTLSRLGAGAVHHVAFRVAGDAEQAQALAHLRAEGHGPTPVQDRTYFHSIYFREPGGVLFEIATDTPGFATDEPADRLGHDLKLPPGVDASREQLESRLVPLDPPPLISGGMA